MDNAKEIVERLDILIALLIPPYNQEKYTMGHEVLPSCDGLHTVNQIVEKTKKTKKAVERSLEKLRANDIVKSIKKDSKTYYIRIA